MKNIKIQAGLFVAKFISSIVLVGLTVGFTLRYLSEQFGDRAVIYGIAVVVGAGMLYFAVKLLYEVRLGQLEIQEQLKNK